jgi:hypothetical protein
LTGGTAGGPLRRASGFLVVALALAGCGGGGKHTASTANTTLPSCANVSYESKALPTGWQVPLPDGFVATEVVDSPKIHQVIGRAPGSFQSTVKFFRESLPAAGYEVGEGDAEEDEAESEFDGHGVHGRWRVNALLGCPDASAVTVAASG